MKYDVFLSHSSKDRADVDQVRSELQALGYRVCVDYDVLPEAAPDKVTGAGAAALTDAMRESASFIYVLAPGSLASQWMPWEMGFFDGARSKVFIWPTTDVLAYFVKDRGLLDHYPLVPIENRAEFLRDNLPRSTSRSSARSALCAQPEMQARPLQLFDFGLQKAAQEFSRQLPAVLADPMHVVHAATEIALTWWRWWGLLPAARPASETPRLAVKTA
ncbi:MAG: toll/interleukin-1 receptor domain-containing protein [Rhodocyclaceae bacterium]|nr:toll/interleukin-1 receptor domain-containing protein [Rhodocyclaceae bacterium]MBX3669936.1 toll/interleukin-1 receptor domain-containing protein [Rhodocyclaceae bacterium]